MTNKPKLPPDPEGLNDSRALWADAAIRTFRHETGTDLEDSLGDLLCDLMHWADRYDFDFEDMLNRAGDHYAEETGQMPWQQKEAAPYAASRRAAFSSLY